MFYDTMSIENMFTPGSIPAIISAFFAILIGGWVIYRIIRPEFDQPNSISHRELSENERDILKKYFVRESSVKKKAIFLIPLSLVIFISGFFIYTTTDGSNNVLIQYLAEILVLISLGVFVYVIIHFHKSLKISDLKNPVFRVEGKVYANVEPTTSAILCTKGGPTYGFKIANYPFDYKDILEENRANIEDFHDGDTVTIEYSPKSKIVWTIKKV